MLGFLARTAYTTTWLGPGVALLSLYSVLDRGLVFVALQVHYTILHYTSPHFTTRLRTYVLHTTFLQYVIEAAKRVQMTPSRFVEALSLTWSWHVGSLATRYEMTRAWAKDQMHLDNSDLLAVTTVPSKGISLSSWTMRWPAHAQERCGRASPVLSAPQRRPFLVCVYTPTTSTFGLILDVRTNLLLFPACTSAWITNSTASHCPYMPTSRLRPSRPRRGL